MTRTFFDIETGPLPDEELRAMLPPFNPAEVKTGQMTDPLKVAAKIAAAEASHFQDFKDAAALYPQTGRVLLIGFLHESTPYLGVSLHRESEILSTFWHNWLCYGDGVGQFIGWNIFQFDLPMLVNRSRILGVKIPAGVQRGRYWHQSFVDLLEAWRCGTRPHAGGKGASNSLYAISRAFGLGAKQGSGKGFADLFAADRPAALAYNADELAKLAQLYQRFQLGTPASTALPEYTQTPPDDEIG